MKPAASEAAADAVEPVEAAVPAESVEPAEDAAAVEEAGEAPAAEQPEGRMAEVESAEGGDADDTPTLNLDEESQDDPDEEPGAEALEREPAEAVEAVKAAEAAVPSEPAESTEQSEEPEVAPAVVEQPEEKAPATEAAEPVATPASTRIVDEAATPAEALSPYESAGADAAAETRRSTAWSPDSGDMPPSITPKSLSGASPSSPEQTTPAVDSARAAEPAEGDADPVGDNAAPAAVPETLAAAATTHKPTKAQGV